MLAQSSSGTETAPQAAAFLLGGVAPESVQVTAPSPSGGLGHAVSLVYNVLLQVLRRRIYPNLPLTEITQKGRSMSPGARLEGSRNAAAWQ